MLRQISRSSQDFLHHRRTLVAAVRCASAAGRMATTTSLRRSTRSSAAKPEAVNATSKAVVATASARKRSSKKNVSNEEIASNAIAEDPEVAAQDTVTPVTPKPSKRRKLNDSVDVPSPVSKPPPVTPTPAAIGLMLSNTGVKSRPARGSKVGSATKDTNLHVLEDRPATDLAPPDGANLARVSEGEEALHDDAQATPSRAGVILPVQAPDDNDTLLKTICAHFLAVDPALQPHLERHHCQPFSPAGLAEKIDPFRALASGIMGQQVSGAAARSIKNKFVALFPPASAPNGFPLPAVVAATPLPTLRTAGLSQRKAEYIQGLAEKFASGELTAAMLTDASDAEVMQLLTAVRGLGVWSVEMFMCFGLKRTDVFSTGDLGVQRGCAAYVGRDTKKLRTKPGKWKYMSEADMLATAEPFRPYRSVFMWYMWRIEDVDVEVVTGS